MVNTIKEAKEEYDLLISCSCDKKFLVDPCTEENTVRKKNNKGHTFLMSKCPYCGKEQ